MCAFKIGLVLSINIMKTPFILAQLITHLTSTTTPSHLNAKQQNINTYFDGETRGELHVDKVL